MASPLRLFVVALAIGCNGKDPYNPGTPLGIYQVDGTLKSDSCVVAPKSWSFSIKLSRDAHTIYWVQGGMPVSGVLGPDGKAHLESERVDVPNPDGGTSACELTRIDTLDLVLATEGAHVPSFTATLGYAFAATPGTDCTSQLQAWGGELAALPCETRYDLTGTWKSK